MLVFNRYRWTWGSISLLSIVIWPVVGLGQVQADLTSNTTVRQRQLSKVQVTGGQIINGSLFHSFRNFSVPNQSSVLFQVSPDTPIINIFARVTGRKASRIAGTLAINGPANFILINPNGINFARNARLNISGSLLATTGDAIQFANGQSFSAIAPQNTQLLTVKIPTGIQFGASPKAIINRAQTDRGATGLKLQRNQQFSLIGGNIRFLQGASPRPMAM